MFGDMGHSRPQLAGEHELLDESLLGLVVQSFELGYTWEQTVKHFGLKGLRRTAYLLVVMLKKIIKMHE
jgi:hypothetical protein